MHPRQRRLLTEELGFLASRFEACNPAAMAPEFFSGNPESPVWFLLINATGNGPCPTWQTARNDPDQYLDYYLGRYRGRPSGTVMAHGLPKITKTTRALMDYVQALAEGMGRPKDASRLLFKTNCYGAQTKRARDLLRLVDPIDLAPTIERLIAGFAPPVVIGFGSAPSALLAAMGPCLAYPTVEDIRSWDGVTPLRLTFPRTPAHIFSWGRTMTLQELGRKLFQPGP